MKWICVQNGAREHYAIPRALHQTNRLEMLFTEAWAGPLLRHLACAPFRSLAARHHSGLAGVQVIHWTWPLLYKAFTSKIANKNRPSGICDTYDGFIREGQWFSCHVQRFLEQQGTDLQDKIIFSYDTTALELFQWAKQRGAICVLGQMDLARTEAEIVSAERTHWPGWALQEEDVPEAYHQRREQEWALADCIVVNSRWSAEALAKQGVSQNKLAVIPLCYEADTLNAKKQKRDVSVSAFQFSESSPLHILFLGQVILRKGIQYLIEAAKLLQGEPVHFDVVGPVGIAEDAIKAAPSNMTFHGRANRAEASRWYSQTDVFVLPTISDGFAITQIEAMAHGLPVVATPHCGEVVTDGVDGFIVPVRDPLALVQVIQRYLGEPELLRLQSAAALSKSRQFSLKKLAANLSDLEHNLKMETDS